MNRYFEVTLRYQKLQENGAVKKVSEKFLADALSITEAESVVTEKMQPFISGEFIATSAKTAPIAEVMGDKDCGKFYLAKVAFITLDEKTAKEKKTLFQMLVGAEDFDSACTSLKAGMAATLADWELVSLSESPILDVF